MNRDGPEPPSPLENRSIALPENRQLDVMAALFARRGARIWRIPLVSILDAPDQAPVLEFLRRFTAHTPDYFIILTGEGLRRLLSAADRHSMSAEFERSLRTACKICRGPKPARVLRELGMKPALSGTSPTTAGVIEALGGTELENRSVAVQLYGDDPNKPLIDYLQSRSPAEVRIVHPYIYASASDDRRVREFILALDRGEVDAIAFTSKPQVRRLFAVAEKFKLQARLRRGLDATRVAAVGPVVRDELRSFGCEVAAMPEGAFFMKPLLRAMETMLASAGATPGQ